MVKMNIGEFARITGVSVRTLHYYDEIGLLKPDFVCEDNGYRFYGEEALGRMQEILLFRELDFSLKSIREIISSQAYDKTQALKDQRRMLILKRQRMDRIIAMLESVGKGEKIMDFKGFDSNEINSYRDEVKRRWGETDAYREHSRRTADYSAEKWNEAADGLSEIIARFAELNGAGERADCDKATETVKRLQGFITKTQYTCTDEILKSLGEMYIADERFTSNIDKSGEGTALFMSNAIKAYCEQKM